MTIEDFDIIVSTIPESGRIDRLFRYFHAAGIDRCNENYIDTPRFLEQVQKIHQMLPHCRLTNASNGDYLDNITIRDSAKAGLSFLRINYYPTDEETANHETLWTRTFLCRLRRYNGGRHDTKIVIKNDGYFEAQWWVDGMQVHFVSMRPERVLTSNRGGTLGDSFQRTTPCLSTRLYIDYNGSVMPCCHARSDINEHVPLILGNINQQSITEIVGGGQRKELLTAISNPGTLPKPCRKCNANYQGGW